MRLTLLAASSALLLGACSMASPHGPKKHHVPHYGAAYGHAPQANPCVPTVRPCASGYAVAPSATTYYPAAHRAKAPAYLGQHAPYGQAVKPHYATPHNYGPHGLRGPMKPRGYAYGNLGAVAYDGDTDLLGVQGRLGYQSASFIGGEVEGSIGVTDETIDVLGVPVTQEVENSLGAFAVARLPLNEQFSVHGRAGYHATKIGVDDGVTDISSTHDGIAYGAGAQYNFTPRDGIRLDYTRYDLDAGGLDALSLGYARKF